VSSQEVTASEAIEVDREKIVLNEFSDASLTISFADLLIVLFVMVINRHPTSHMRIDYRTSNIGHWSFDIAICHLISTSVFLD
jgi:hypothetical protein